jgi:hypothetical protein
MESSAPLRFVKSDAAGSRASAVGSGPEDEETRRMRQEWEVTSIKNQILTPNFFYNEVKSLLGIAQA